jgi:response regulator NasT
MKVLIISTNDDITAMFVDALKSIGAADITVADKFNDGFDVAVFNLPLEGRFGLEEAATAAKSDNVFVIAAAAAKNIDKIIEKIGDNPLMLIAKPFKADALALTMRNLWVSAVKAFAMRGRLAEAENKIADLKLIDRAKFVLAEYLSLTEAEAHRYIQKNAMDRRVRQAEVAKEILRTYEII